MTAEPLIPPDLLVDEQPLTDVDLRQLWEWSDRDPEVAGPPPGRAAAWQIDGPNTAAWAMAKYAEKAAAIDAINQLCQERIERIQRWARSELGDLPRDLVFFENHLKMYALDQRAASDGKVKTIKTPVGNVGTKETAARVSVSDEDVVLEWAREHAPAAVKETLLITPIAAATEIIEIPTKVVLHPCAEIIEIGVHPLVAVTVDEYLAKWGLANGITCPSCGQDALVARWFKTELAAVGPDRLPVPGAHIEPAKVTASISLPKAGAE